MLSEKLCDYIGCREMVELDIRYCDKCIVKKSYNNDYIKQQRKKSEWELFKHKARCKVQYAIRSGKIKREKCKIRDCDVLAEAHHEDYSQPYNVVWLCKQHHTEYHSKVLA